MLRNLRETITDKVQQAHPGTGKEQREGFIDHHDEVDVELERQRSRRNPRGVAGREQTPIRAHARGLEEHRDSQGGLPERDRSFDFSQRRIARALGMLDSDRPSLVDSQELPLELARENAMSPDLADRLSLSLDDSHEGQGNLSVNKTMRDRTLSVAGIEIRQ